MEEMTVFVNEASLTKSVCESFQKESQLATIENGFFAHLTVCWLARFYLIVSNFSICLDEI